MHRVVVSGVNETGRDLYQQVGVHNSEDIRYFGVIQDGRCPELNLCGTLPNLSSGVAGWLGIRVDRYRDAVAYRYGIGVGTAPVPVQADGAINWPGVSRAQPV